MFRVEAFRRIAQGEYQAVITLDDPGMLPMLRFLRRVSDVAETLHLRIEHERRVLRLTDERKALEPEVRAERAKLLAIYRELPGPRAARVKQLRRIIRDREVRITYDGVVSLISRAIADERTFRRSRVLELAGEGLTCRAIASRLCISPAQASRLSGPRSADAPGCPTIDDLTTRTYPRAVFPRERTGPVVAAAG